MDTGLLIDELEKVARALKLAGFRTYSLRMEQAVAKIKELKESVENMRALTYR
jgi:hypothetical protein